MEPVFTPLSAYILTYNSEKYLDALLSPLRGVADEIIILDSGSSDRTENIARQYGCRFLVRPLDNFRDQRNFALGACQHDMVLSLDSDEVPTPEFVAALQQLKQEGFVHEAYRVRRDWFVMGEHVSVLYPVSCPDYPLRLINRRTVSFDQRSNEVHEMPFGYRSAGRIEAPVNHYTFETQAEIDRKTEHYTALAARDQVRKGLSASWLKMVFHPPLVWVLWYLIKGGWRDGRVGWILGRYAFQYTRKKIIKTRDLYRQQRVEVSGKTSAA